MTFGPTPLLAVRLLFACAMVVLFAIDLEHQILPNEITLPGIAIGFLFSLALPPGWRSSLIGLLVGGLFPLSSPQFDGVPESWMSYLAVDDVDARVKKAQSAGATLMRPIFDVPGVGRIAILKEPGGAGVGWMTPAKA